MLNAPFAWGQVKENNMSNVDTVLKKIKDEEVKFVDLRFTDPRGKW